MMFLTSILHPTKLFFVCFFYSWTKPQRRSCDYSPTDKSVGQYIGWYRAITNTTTVSTVCRMWLSASSMQQLGSGAPLSKGRDLQPHNRDSKWLLLFRKRGLLRLYSITLDWNTAVIPGPPLDCELPGTAQRPVISEQYVQRKTGVGRIRGQVTGLTQQTRKNKVARKRIKEAAIKNPIWKKMCFSFPHSNC